MPDNEKLFTALGRLEESVKNIKESTDKIPDLATGFALMKEDIYVMKPKVERHQKIMYFGSGIMTVFSIAWTAILDWMASGGHK